MGQGFRFRDSGGVEMECALHDSPDIQKLLDGWGVGAACSTWPWPCELIKRNLDGRTALLGFAGSPWTLANFMLEGGSAKQFGRRGSCSGAIAPPTICWPAN